MCAKVQSCSHPFVPIHSSSIPPHELALPLPIQGSLTPRALFPAAPCAVLGAPSPRALSSLLLPLLGELFVPCSSPPSMWRKFFSIHGSEPGRLGGVCYSPRSGLARVIVTGAGSHFSGAGPVPVISMAVHGARRKTRIARCGCLRKHT